MTTTPRRSPVHGQLEPLGPTWALHHGCPLALHFGDPQQERAARTGGSLCDVSACVTIGLKGPGAAERLAQQAPVPDAIYGSALRPDGSLLVRTGPDEFLIDGGFTPRRPAAPGAGDSEPAPGVHVLVRADATFLLAGTLSRAVLAQTCGVDFDEMAPHRLIMTRLAGVSCAILPQPDDTPVYRIWADYSYGPWLWRTLAEILTELGGAIVGAAAHGCDLAPA